MKVSALFVVLSYTLAINQVGAFTSTTPSISSPRRTLTLNAVGNHHSIDTDNGETPQERRAFLTKSTASLLLATVATTTTTAPNANALVSGAQDQSDKYAPKFVQQYEDFTPMDEGWQFKDVKVGTGGTDVTIEPGDRVVFDWSGYTIGYFGRPFEAKGGPQGGAFDKDLDYSRTVIGSHTLIPAVESALTTMKPGGVRQVIVPYGDLSYPADDLEHVRVGPKPTTFSGQRALNFVLENPRVDRTLLFNLKLVRVDKSNGKGGFVRG